MGMSGGQEVKRQVALSFAGEDREYVEEVALQLRNRAVNVFYDHFEWAALWGKELVNHLQTVYGSTADCCVVFVSEHYLRKYWTHVEFQAALSRALDSKSVYILPFFLDDTELPGLSATVGRLYAREVSQTDLVDIICERLGQILFSSDAVQTEFDWVATRQWTIGHESGHIVEFQGIDIRTVGVSAVVNQLSQSILSSTVQRGELVYWTRSDDSIFDRYHATSSAITALAQAGLPIEDAVARHVLSFLGESDPGDLDDRAATMCLLAFGLLPESSVVAFIDALKAKDLDTSGSGRIGEFVLPQASTARGGSGLHQQILHSGGAAFHACHIADILLHIPVEMASARTAAAPLLARLRTFLANHVNEHEGWLVGLLGQRRAQTLYAYALFPKLSLPLPRHWLEVFEECWQLAASGSELDTFLAAMNMHYAASANDLPAMTSVAERCLRSFLSEFSIDSALAMEDVVERSAALRAVVYASTSVGLPYSAISHQVSKE
jgi:hypothetical protein